MITQKWSLWQQGEGEKTRSATAWGCGEADGLGARRPRFSVGTWVSDRSKPNQLQRLAGQREGGGGAWALRKFRGKVEPSEKPGGGWSRREGQTPISLLLLRWPGEWACEAEASASGGTLEFMGGDLGGVS